ncbi:MAG: oxidoreductase [Chitinophagaceae bacterium]|nr:MAG: oxidoreductase [Chitinophagaceae bacterium]
MGMKAILIGATGLIGQNLLTKLLADEDYSDVLVISRKKLNVPHTKLKALIINFDELANYKSEIVGDVVFCCLGTTIKKTPDLAVYRKIDYQYPIDVASLAQANGAKQYHLVSAMGANVKSRLFYSRTKGEVERDLQKIAFEAIHIYRPALLDGDRKEKRAAEKIMIGIFRLINPILIGPLKKYRSIKIDKVADAMLKNATTTRPGIHIYNSDEL